MEFDASVMLVPAGVQIDFHVATVRFELQWANPL